MEAGGETHRLREEIERALRRAFDPADVLPRLARLARLAAPASDDGIFAHRQLAELLVERHPWRAAIYARRALAHRAEDDRAWAVLAFCQTLLGNFRCAATAYENAIAAAPDNPWYAHNLGHLLDVGLGAPLRALPWLRSAYAKEGENAEIVASFVHALARAGRTLEARGVLEHALERLESRELVAMLRWLDQGAPAREPREARGARARVPRTPLARVLARGLSHLPFDAQQRERALVLAEDVLANGARLEAEANAKLAEKAVSGNGVVGTAAGAKGGGSKALPRSSAASPKGTAEDVAGLAAAVAYAIVYVDHVPLSQAEVAAPFRVAVGRLRGRFADLRAKLAIIPGDARYATPRTC
jgi:Flp pilus assembly protein TadD